MPPVYQELHDDSVVIDAVCPLLRRTDAIEWYKEGGFTAVAPTVGGSSPAGETLRHLGLWARLLKTRPDLLLVRSAQDILNAKREGRLGIILHFQGTEPIENDLNLVDAYKDLGVGMIQLAYNQKNRVGDGCDERTDAGLSHFGASLIRRMNEAKVVIDCSHTGYRTTMDAIELSAAPVVFSHSNPKGVFTSHRNIGDDQIKAVARSGGLIGMNGCPYFISDAKRPSLDQFIDHFDYVSNLVGIDHIALGIDYWAGQAHIAEDDEAEQLYRTYIENGMWRPETYPPPPWYHPEGIETPRTFSNLTKRLVERGYKTDEIKKILGGNWVRVFRAVWGY